MQILIIGGLHTTGTKDTTQLNLNHRCSSLSSNSNNQPAGVQAGDRAPDSLLPDGSWLSDVYRGTHFTVLRSGAHGPGGKWTAFGGDKVREFHLPENLSPLFGKTNANYVVRPDGYIGLIANVGDASAVCDYLSKFLRHETTG